MAEVKNQLKELKGTDNKVQSNNKSRSVSVIKKNEELFCFICKIGGHCTKFCTFNLKNKQVLSNFRMDKYRRYNQYPYKIKGNNGNRNFQVKGQENTNENVKQQNTLSKDNEMEGWGFNFTDTSTQTLPQVQDIQQVTNNALN